LEGNLFGKIYQNVKSHAGSENNCGAEHLKIIAKVQGAKDVTDEIKKESFVNFFGLATDRMWDCITWNWAAVDMASKLSAHEDALWLSTFTPRAARH
jgi:hypothetical protein